ncbi:MAG: C40 family peptidase, partial [Duncaniella sp.]|nr:C40 family peptidase [Duncaniella sp.]
IIYILLISIFLTAIPATADDFALVKVAFTSLRSEPRHSSEMLTQAIMGMPMQVLADTTPDWVTVRLADGYEGFINRSAIIRKTAAEMQEWKSSHRVTIASLTPQEVIGQDSKVLCRLEAGSIVTLSGDSILLPDGRKGLVDNLSEINSRLPSEDEVLGVAHKLMGAPYLWGGNTVHALDCSGLVRVCFMQFGILTPRDASQLYICGRKRESAENPERGDLLFFSSKPDGGITHVALYLGDGRYIHCSGEVKISTMSSEDPDFSKRYFRGAIDWSNLKGFMPISSHRLYY